MVKIYSDRLKVICVVLDLLVLYQLDLKRYGKDFVDACNILFPTEGHVIMMLRA